MRNTTRFGIAALLVAASACNRPTTAPSAEALPQIGGVREISADQQIKQALARFTFGPRPGDYANVSAMGLDRWLVAQLSPENVPDTRTDSLLGLLPVSHRTIADLVTAYPPQDLFVRMVRRERGLADKAQYMMTADDSARFKVLNDTANRIAQQELADKLLRDVESERQLLEVMTDFWENHFSVFNGKMPTRFTIGQYDRDVIRPHALGKFRDLLGAVAHSPAMLYYLDNYLSKRNGLNENYGRELLELHTLGVDGGYTQHDVIEVARALTGWTIREPRTGGAFMFRPEWHDAGAKHVLGHTLAAKRGVEDGEEVLDIVAHHPSTARFIATKLARHFVSDDPPKSLVDRLAETFRSTDGDMRQVMAVLVASPETYSRAAYHSKVKTPYELVVSTLRMMQAPSDTSGRRVGLSSRLGQPMFGRLTPDGWPDVGDAWMNSGAIIQRINFGMNAAAGRIAGINLNRWSPSAQLARAPYAQQVDGAISTIFLGEASAETRRILLEGKNPLATEGAVQMAARAPLPNFAQLVGLALGAPEFQRR